MNAHLQVNVFFRFVPFVRKERVTKKGYTQKSFQKVSKVSTGGFLYANTVVLNTGLAN